MIIFIKLKSSLIIIIFFIFSINSFSQNGIVDFANDSNDVKLNLAEEEIIKSSKLVSSERIYLELFASPLAGAVIFLPAAYTSGYIGTIFSDYYDEGEISTYLAIGGLIGYSVGNALSVYLFEKNGNRNVEFGKTVLASLIGSGMAIGVAIVNGGDLWNNEIGLIALISFPAIASIIYANLIAPKKSNENPLQLGNENKFIKTRLTHKDFYNSSKLINLEIMRITF